MKLPSINYLLTKSKESLLRFPATLLSALVSVCIAIYLIEYNDDIKNYFPYINILITSALGIPLFFGLSIFNSSQNFNTQKNIFSHVLCAILLVIIYFSLPDSDTTHNTSVPYIRYGLFNLIIHLLVSFSPFLKGNKLNGFWNFNKILFIRFFTSLLYSGFLYVGLILALTALKLLFDIDIHEELYFEFFIVIIGLFNTWFFISGIPSSLENLESINEYPNGLKIFAQYVLLPLLVLYLIILYSYGVKIIITWDWPKGIVSYLISCVSVLGILTVLLFHPYGHLKNNSWIKKFTRVFYFLLLPLVAILFIAIGFRIGDYGITINRYVILLLGIWLSVVALYFSFNNKNIKLIPMSLALFLGLMSFGPWSMFSVSERSQINRLVTILENNDILQNGKIRNEVIWQTDSLPKLFYSESINTNDKILNDSLHNEVMSIIDYLDSHHGFSGISDFFNQNIDSLIVISLDSNKHRDESSVYMRTMGLSNWYKNTNYNYFTFSVADNKVIQISPYDYLVDFDLGSWDRNSDKDVFKIDSSDYILELNRVEMNSLLFIEKNDSLRIDINEVLLDLINRYGIESEYELNQSEMVIEKKTKSIELKILFNSIEYKAPEDSVKIEYVRGRLLFRKR